MPRHAFVLSALDSVRLLQGIDATFAVDPVGTLRCKMGDEQYFVTSEEELRILVEIWVLGTYNYFLSGPSIIVDIGMNVGLASLFFARCTDCIIYGFEPVQETYEAALRNFALNCGPAARIKSHNFGLGSENRRARFAFNLAWKGLAGIRSALPRTQSVDSISYRDVEIRNVNEVLGEIIAAHLDHTLVLKVDCEGGNTRSSTLFIKRDCSIRSTC